MRVTTIGSEKTMDELVTRLYGKTISRTKRRAAANALTEVNPQLGTALHKGAAVVVPDALDLRVLKRAELSDPTGELEQSAAAALAAFRVHLTSAAKASADRAAAEAKLLRSAQMKRLIREMPELKAHGERVANAIKARQAQAKRVQDFAAEGLANIEKRLALASGKSRP